MKRKSLYIILSITIISLLSLTIAYAALNATLSITGSANINASTWKIVMLPSSVVTTGSATYTTPTVTNTTIGNYSVGLTKPGDSVTMIFNVENQGNLNAEIESVINSIPTCTKEGRSTCLVNGDKINSTTAIKIRIALNENMTSVADRKVVISNLNHQIIYKQTDKECTMGVPEK